MRAHVPFMMLIETINQLSVAVDQSMTLDELASLEPQRSRGLNSITGPRLLLLISACLQLCVFEFLFFVSWNEF